MACRVSSKLSVKGESNNPKLYDIAAVMAIDIVDAAHTTQDKQLSG